MYGMPLLKSFHIYLSIPSINLQSLLQRPLTPIHPSFPQAPFMIWSLFFYITTLSPYFSIPSPIEEIIITKERAQMGTCSNSAADRSKNNKHQQPTQQWYIVKRDDKTHRLTLTSRPQANNKENQKALVRKFTDEYFDKFDSNHDNLMSFKDVHKMLNHMYKKEDPKGLSKVAVTRLMNQIDRNNDGKVCKDEFYLFCKNKLI